MSLSDCIKCWDNPCTCGHEYESMTSDRRVKTAVAVMKALSVDEVRMVIDAIGATQRQSTGEDVDFSSLAEMRGASK